MTWARLDDQTATSPGWVALVDVALKRVAADRPEARPDQIGDTARQLARNAKSVHMFSLMWSVPALSDGRITPSGAEQVCTIGSLTTTEFYDGADLLVDAGAWRKIRPTKADPLGAYQMILGWAPGEQPTRQEDIDRRKRGRMRDALREGGRDYPNKVAAIERAAGHCEYCDSTDPTQIDHIDPRTFSNALDNLAYVCARCNKRKGANHELSAVGMSFTARARRARARFAERAAGAHESNAKPKKRRKPRTAPTGGPRVDTPVDTVPGRVGSGRDGSGGVGSGRALSLSQESDTRAAAPPSPTDADDSRSDP